MSLQVCCCVGECTSIYRVFKPCDNTYVGLEYRAPALLLVDLQNSGMVESKVYRYSPTLECDPYCGQWVCINDAVDNLCRPGASPCPDCAVWDNTLDEPFRRVMTTEVPSFPAKFTEVDDCCDADCPTDCGFGSPVICSDPFDPATCPEPCFNANLIQYNVSLGLSSTPGSRDLTGSTYCGAQTVTTTASPSIVSVVSGTYNSRANCQDDTLVIGIKVKVTFSTSPWGCDTGLITDPNTCTGWCADFDDDPNDRPTNDQYSHLYYEIVIYNCGQAVLGTMKTANPPGVNPATCSAIPAWCVRDTPWDETTGNCGYAPGTYAPQVPPLVSGTPTYASNGIGWGGNAICLTEQRTFSFLPQTPQLCVFGGSTTNNQPGTVDFDLSLRLSMPQKPNPCV